MPKIPLMAVCLLVLLPFPQAASPQAANAPAGRFVGTWVGTQSWAIADPPPGAREDQPVALVIELVDGKLVGTMRPFLGGDDGATLVESTIVGDELRARAIVGPPRAQGTAGGGRGTAAPRNWKEAVTVTFALTSDGLNLAGTADVVLGDVSWMTFAYDLSKRRSRY